MRKGVKAEMHGCYGGRTLQDKIRALMDKQNGRVRKAEKPNSDDPSVEIIHKHGLAVGRFEGMAATLAILRSSSINEEMRLSDERCGFAS
jgi:hypothetical protein